MNTPPAIIKQGEQPVSAEPLGYVIYLPEKEVFLAYCQKSYGLVQRAFTRSLDHAKIYQSLDEVFADAGVCREPAEPRYLYHAGNHRPIAKSQTASCMRKKPGPQGLPSLAKIARNLRQRLRRQQR